MTTACVRRRMGEVFMAGCLVVGLFAHSGAQSEQRIEVTIKEFAFVTKQIPLRLGVPTVISIRNVDPERHDFGSSMFDGVLTRIESAGVICVWKGDRRRVSRPQARSGHPFHDGSSRTARISVLDPPEHERRTAAVECGNGLTHEIPDDTYLLASGLLRLFLRRNAQLTLVELSPASY